MPATKTLNTRIIHKHDTAENWGKAENFIPNKGELIVYDIDTDYDYERFKIGDGIHSVNELPFADDDLRKNVENKVDKVEGKDLSTNDFTDAEKEKLAAAVLSVGGILPNTEGNVPLCLVKNVTIVDGSAISPDILQYMGVNTMAEIVEWLRNKGTHSVIFHRDIRDVNGKTAEVVKDTGSNILRLEDGTYNAIVYFGDDLCPIIVDSKNNKIYFDPDWVAPTQNVKSINGITPNENGRLNTAVIIENDESTGNISIIRNPDLLWFALQSDPSASDISIFQRVAYEEDNSQDYLMINTELESLVFSQTDEIVVEIWRLGFGGYAPDLLVDNIAHTITLDPDWVAPAEPITELVQADWNENDETSDAYILNKPETATDDDIIALMQEVDAFPVVMDESGAIMTDEDEAILLA